MKPVTEKLVWDRFCQAVDFKRQIGLYDTVRTNENYFIGNQWEGVQAKGLPTPVFNFLKRVVLFQVATITSDNMTLQAAPLLPTAQFPARRLEEITGVLNGQFAALFESAKLTTRLREMMRNSAVDGDGCMYFCFDPDVENGQPVKGEIQAEVVENTRVHFGNPNQRDPQKQPWIILSRRMLLEDARALAERWGADPEALRPDQEAFHNRYDSYTGDKVTVLTHFWRDRTTGSIFCCESAERGMLRPPYDTGLRRYPLIWLSWDFVQDCYHGQSLITGLIPNQNFINKIFALTGVSLLTTAFPKVIYDKNRLRSWDGSVGTAVAVAGGWGGPGDGPRCCKSPDCPVHGAVYGQDPELPGGLGGGSGRGEAGEYLRHFGPPTGCQHPYGDHQAKPLPGGGGYGADFSGHDGGPVRKPLGPGAGAGGAGPV